ncbi:ribonuclease T2 [Trametopsis cervina]|nr:ribonuclease T2 [Trametopsis cervina]
MFAALSLLAASLFGSASVNAAAFESRDLLLDPSLLIPGQSTCNILYDLNPNTTAQADLCCFNAPGGHLLQTQFWDYESPLTFAGPNDSWTIHGLWPDHCDGTFDQFCAPSREVQNITQILQAAGENQILDYMHKFWKDNTGNDESFWEHEFNKHGTCISTLDPQCIKNFKAGDDVIIFVKRTISLFQTLPTHLFLAAHGIVPSTTKQYKLADINKVLTAATGKKPTVGCDGTGNAYLHEMWYHYVTKGSVINGLFVHADADSTDTCADDVWYWPKGVPVPKPTPTTTSSAPSATSTEDKGTIQVFTADGKNVGCILSKGTWSQQTCATFRPTPGSASGTFDYTSSKGLCAVDATNGTLSCGPPVTAASDFTNSTITSGSLLAFNASSVFSADVLPTGTVQSTVFIGGDHSQVLQLIYTRS